jgi:hypothetical protein
MNRKLVFALALLFAVGLMGCTGNVPASATIAPTLEPTATLPPTAVPTIVPTVVPTEVPTSTAIPEPTVWDIAEQMGNECASNSSLELVASPVLDRYLDTLMGQVTKEHPEFLSGAILVSPVAGLVLTNDGTNRNPFAFLDLPPFVWENVTCEGYVIAYEFSEENTNRDGVLAGEAWVFYEVGGGEVPFVFDGQLKEINFNFPLVP